MNQPTPRSLGYHMPAEWEPQEAIWLTWPHNELTWPGGTLEEVRVTYVLIMRALHTDQKIKLLVKDADNARDARSRLTHGGVPVMEIEFIHMPTEDSWIRDYGPTF